MHLSVKRDTWQHHDPLASEFMFKEMDQYRFSRCRVVRPLSVPRVSPLLLVCMAVNQDSDTEKISLCLFGEKIVNL